MEKHRCKLCYRKFANGRALGGHMRSHMMNLPITPKLEPLPPQPTTGAAPAARPPRTTTSCETESSTDSPPSPMFSLSYSDHDESSSLVTLQDRESETESFKRNTTRKRRSKRIVLPKALSSNSSDNDNHQHYYNYNNNHDYSVVDLKKKKDHADSDPVSSISEVTSEEDLAYCLLMMSRDKWTNNKCVNTTRKKKYKCETCNKVFRSYQALGGHRASHKKIRGAVEKLEEQRQSALYHTSNEDFIKHDENINVVIEEKKVHECPVCFRVFASGQALGGHKRSHVLSASTNTMIPTTQSSNKVVSRLNDNDRSNYNVNDSLIDLNLPAPVDYEEEHGEISQIAVSSAVSEVHSVVMISQGQKSQKVKI